MDIKKIAEKMKEEITGYLDNYCDKHDYDEIVDYFYEILRSVRDEALEEAAKACDEDPRGACPECAELIRALAHGGKP